MPAAPLPPADRALQAGFLSLAAVTAHVFLAPGGGLSFPGVINTAEPFAPGTTLAEDPREKAIIETAAPMAMNLALNTRLLDQTTGATWQLVHRDANPADFTTRFVAVRIVPGVDT